MSRITKLLYKFLLIDLIKGLSVTQRYFFAKRFTSQYPKERLEVKSRVDDKNRWNEEGRYRGFIMLRLDPDSGEELCTGCGLCMRACPDDCITVENEKRPEGKKRRHKTFVLDFQRCMFCDLCVEACPTQALYTSDIYEMAVYDRKDLVHDLDTLYKGPEVKRYKK
ncbi:NuoI/complex I 23 kDa subunit family protein [Acidobacteriota bacterium]